MGRRSTPDPLSTPGVRHEPALTGPSGREAAEPKDALGEEPALRGVAGLRTFSDLYRARRQLTPPLRRWAAVVAAAVASGLLGVIGAFFASFGSLSLAGAVLGVVVVGPIAEETAKAIAGWYLAQQRPWLVPAAWAVVAVTVAGGLGFAVIENWLYLEVYIDEPSAAIVRWRWLFGPLVHGVGSLIVGTGLARSWRRLHVSGSTPRPDGIVPWIGAAAAIHGSYNLLAILLESTGRLPV